MEVSTKATLTPEQVKQACEEFVLRKILGQGCIVSPMLPPEPEAPMAKSQGVHKLDIDHVLLKVYITIPPPAPTVAAQTTAAL